MFRHFKPLLIAVILALSPPVAAFEMGVIGPVLRLGTDGAWDLRDEGEFYVMDNEQDSQSIKYFYVYGNEEAEGRRSVSVTIDFREISPSTRAGLIVGYDEDTGDYFLFTIAPTGEIMLLQRSPSAGTGNVLYQITSSSVTNGINTINLQESGERVTISVNEGGPSMTSDRAAMARGGIGIVAWGLGETAFSDFTYDIGAP